MAGSKTQKTNASPRVFVGGLEDETRRKDCQALMKLMKKVTNEEARMWGPSIVGFGNLRYKYASGRAAEWFLVGFSPRKRDLTLYLMGGVERHPKLLARLGKHKTGKSCLYLKSLADVDMGVLEELIVAAVTFLRKTYPTAGLT